MKRFLTTCLLAGLPMVAVAEPVVVTTAQGQGADNQVMGFGDARESLNKGGASNMQVRGHAYSGNNYVGVLRFDVSEVTLPESIQTVTLTLTVTDKVASAGRLVAFGLRDGFAGGDDGSGQPESGETDYVEGDLDWKPAKDAGALCGDTAPGYREKAAGLKALTWAQSPFMHLGDVEIAEGTAAGSSLTFDGDDLKQFILDDTNGVVVIYLASDDAFVQLGTQEGKAPATLSFTSAD